MSVRKLGFCMLVSAGLSSVPVFAQRPDAQLGLFAMPLEQLLSISVVSKKEEPLVKSPGVVTTYSAKDLRSLGLSSLQDFLHFVPGLELNSRLNPPSLIQVRGTPASTNQKVLFMLNGVPYWMPDNGEFPLFGIPFNAIERIEVIRGPGSVVYGTNASAGVINVITRNDDDGDLLIQGNSDALFDSSLYAGGRHSDDLTYNLSVGVRRGGDFDYSVDNAFALDFTESADGILEKEIEYESLLGSVAYKDLTLMFQTYQSRESGDANGSIVSPSQYKARGTLLSLEYARDFDWGDYEVFSSWNRYYRDVFIDGALLFFGLDEPSKFSFDNSGKGNVRFRNGMTFNYKVSESSRFMFGAEYEERGTENKKFKDLEGGAVLTGITTPPFSFIQLQDDGSWLLVEEDKAYESSVFLQLDHSLDRWRFVWGGRYVSNNKAGSEISPRGSIVYSLDDNQSVKVLYSEGFNSPTFSQSSATDSLGVPLNMEVDAETIQTWDLAYTASSKGSHHVVSLFHTEIEDLITSNSNVEERYKRDGLEYEFQYHDTNWLSMLGLSYIWQGDGKGRDDAAEFLSKWYVKGGLAYDWGRDQLGTSLRSAGKRQNADAYYLLNIYFSSQVNERLNMSVTLENILDDAMETPGVRDGREVVIGGTRGFGVGLGLNYRLGNL